MDRLFCIISFLVTRLDVEEQSICAQGSFACLSFLLLPMTRLINKQLKRKILDRNDVIDLLFFIRLACGRGKLIQLKTLKVIKSCKSTIDFVRDWYLLM